MFRSCSYFELHVFQISLGLTSSACLNLRWSKGINSVCSAEFAVKNGKSKLDQVMRLQLQAEGQKQQSSILSVQLKKGDQRSTIGLVIISLSQEFSKKRVKLERCECADGWVELSLVKFKKDSQQCKADSNLINAANKLLNTVERFQYLADLIEQSRQIDIKKPSSVELDQKKHLQSIIQSQSKKLGDLLNLLSEIGNKRILEEVNKLLMT